MKTLERVKHNLTESHLLSKGKRVIVGVSGGPDSMALWHMLHMLQYELGIILHVAHLNHKLRKSADREQQFVEAMGRKWNIPVTAKVISSLRRLSKGSLEEKAREERLKFFSDLASFLKTDVIILAHTQDDLAETILMRLLRGSGLLGLRGILPVRKIKGCYILRPLLNTSRKEIVSYLRSQKIKPCTDPTNKDIKFFRNKIRHQLLPLLEKSYNPNIKDVLANLASILTADYDLLEVEMEKKYRSIILKKKDNEYLSLDLKQFKVLHASQKQMILRKAFYDLTGSLRRLTYKHIEETIELINKAKGRTSKNLPSNINIKLFDNTFQISAKNKLE